MLLARTIGAIALLISASHQFSIPQPTPNQSTLDTRKLIWMIAHKCLDRKAIDDAIKNGANAFEMDLTAYKEGWWAQHPGEKWWDSIGDLFDYIASKKDQGNNVQWVWLDIKNPDAFGDGFGSIQGLQTLVRKKLSPHGVAALYGFSVNSGATDYIKKTLRADEGINYDGSSNDRSTNKTPKDTIKALQSVKVGHRIGSYGWDLLQNSFGTCHEADFNTCTELRQAKESGNWAKVFGWTATDEAGDTDRVNQLFNIAKVDGMIYGFPSAKYYDDAGTRAAAKEIQDWIANHNKDVKLADSNDPNPWSGPV